MDIRDYWHLARRHLVLLVLVPVFAAVAGYMMADRQAPLYRATSVILLRPNDPNERRGTGGDSTEILYAERIVEAGVKIAGGPKVAERAAASLTNGTASEVSSAISVTSSVDANVLEVSATTGSPLRSAEIANAVSAAFIEDRRLLSVQGLETAIADIDENLTKLQTELQRLDSAASGTTNDSLASTARDQYQRLSDQRLGLSIDKGLKRGEAEIISDAVVPGGPISPQPRRSALLAGMLGAMAAGGFVLLKDRFDTRLRSREEAEEVSGLATLAEIPYDKAAGDGALVVASAADPNGAVAEAIRSLRVSLRFLALETPLKVILVTSAMQSDGKTTVSANLAHSYAAGGLRTLLVSGDLRRPRVDRIINSQSDTGLVELLTEMAAEEEHQQVMERGAGHRRPPVDLLNYCHNDAQNLWVLLAGQRVANPVEILGSSVAKELFATCRERFDVVIVDSPPLLAVADAVVLSQFADGVLVVTSLRKTASEALSRGAEILANGQGRILGLVVNRVGRQRGYGYGYGYGYGPGSAYEAGPDPRRSRLPRLFRRNTWPRRSGRS